MVLMVFYHAVAASALYGLYSGNVYADPWRILARGIAGTFILVVGVSLTLSYNRVKSKLGPKQIFQKYLVRGASLFGWGMVVTVVTYLVVPWGYAVFGILHLIGVSIILAYPVLRYRWVCLAGGVLVVAVGVNVNRFVSAFPWLLWLGVRQYGRYMIDWFPVLPWFGVVLLGVSLGLSLYPGGTRRFGLPDLSRVPPIRALAFLGRYSLVIYLLHEPVILAVFMLLGMDAVWQRPGPA
jgi:uncharacterized membrane protein